MSGIRDITIEGHYGGLLGLESPWQVTEVRREPENRQVVVRVAWPAKRLPVCPICAKRGKLADHRERAWRHLDAVGHEVRLECAVPRCQCQEHGVVTMAVPWAGKGSRFTEAFEALAVAVICCAQTVSKAATLLRLSWDTTHQIMERAVERGLVRRGSQKVRYIGLDEKSFRKGQDYISVLTDIEGGRVLEVTPGHRTEDAARLINSLNAEQKCAVEAVAMDMGGGFKAAARQELPKAQIVHDKFHVSKLLNEAVDKTRRMEHQRLLKKGDKLLSGMKYDLLSNAGPPPERMLRFDELCERDLLTAQAWAHKETFREIWALKDVDAAATFFQQWLEAVGETALTFLKKTANTLKEHLVGLLSYFVHPITNAAAEGLNSKIQNLKSSARGFRSFANYRTRILFFCGKLELTP